MNARSYCDSRKNEIWIHGFHVVRTCVKAGNCIHATKSAVSHTLKYLQLRQQAFSVIGTIILVYVVKYMIAIARIFVCVSITCLFISVKIQSVPLRCHATQLRGEYL